MTTSLVVRSRNCEKHWRPVSDMGTGGRFLHFQTRIGRYWPNMIQGRIARLGIVFHEGLCLAHPDPDGEFWKCDRTRQVARSVWNRREQYRIIWMVDSRVCKAFGANGLLTGSPYICPDHFGEFHPVAFDEPKTAHTLFVPLPSLERGRALWKCEKGVKECAARIALVQEYVR